jgi:hypothetical protein
VFAPLDGCLPYSTLKEAITTLYKPYFLVKINCFLGSVNRNFIKIIGALDEEFSTDSLSRKFSANEQQRQMIASPLSAYR